jgi:hypothetical protein
MSRLEPKAFAAAKTYCEKASHRRAQIVLATHVNELTEMWSHFLTDYERAFIRLHKATRQGSAKGWFDQIEDERSNDELLQYVRQARHADEHGLEPITKHVGGNVVIRPIPGETNVIVRRMHMRGGGTMLLQGGDDGALVRVDPADARLIPVLNRGSWYPVPTIHLGKTVADQRPHAIAELAVKYLEAKLSEAKEKFT